jgi:hypothetical protein
MIDGFDPDGYDSEVEVDCDCDWDDDASADEDLQATEDLVGAEGEPSIADEWDALWQPKPRPVPREAQRSLRRPYFCPAQRRTHARPRGRRSAPARRVVSRSAGGGSSGDPDSDAPGEAGHLHLHLDLAPPPPAILTYAALDADARGEVAA